MLGGIIASSGDVMLEAIRVETQRRLMPQQAEQVRIVLSTLGDDAVAIGAALARAPHDRAVRRGHRPAGSRRPRRIDRHRPGPHRRDRAARDRCAAPAARVVDLANHTIVPGFVDVHVHGIEGVDVLDGADAVADVATPPAEVRRHGVLPDVGGVHAGNG
mgnify:CR=1 FL=1